MKLGDQEVRAYGIAIVQHAVLENLRKEVKTTEQYARYKTRLMIFMLTTMLAAYVEEGAAKATKQRSYR